jgi:GAF domain
MMQRAFGVPDPVDATSTAEIMDSMPYRSALRAHVLASMATAAPVGGEGGPTGVLNRVCRTIVAELGVMGAAVNLMSSGSAAEAVVGSSDAVSARVDDLQLTVGEGPCHEALATCRPVQAANLALETRWPGYCSLAQEHGVHAVFAFPLQLGAVSLGVLDIYAAVPTTLDEGQLSLALAFAEIATETLLHKARPGRESFLDPGIRTAIGSRAEIYQAQGMVMIDLGTSLVDALVRIRAFSFGHHRSLGDVAHDIVTGTLRLDDALPGDGHA